MSNLEVQLQIQASKLLSRVRQHQAQRGVFHVAQDKLLELARKEPGAFRKLVEFLLVFPAIQHDDERLIDYFKSFFQAFPQATGLLGLAQTLASEHFVAEKIREQVTRMARQFVPAENLSELQGVLDRLAEHGRAFTADLMGEDVSSTEDAEHYLAQVLKLIDAVAGRPDANISVKPSGLEPFIDSICLDGRRMQAAKERYRTMLRHAVGKKVFLHLDLEDYKMQPFYHRLLREVWMEPEFRHVQSVGLVLQAEYENGDKLCDEILAFAKQRGTPFTIRLVKGAYHDLEILWAQQNGWQIPVSQGQGITDARYERLTEKILKMHTHVRGAFATHNPRSVLQALLMKQALGVPDDCFEIQMLYGMGEALGSAWLELAQELGVKNPKLRIYTGYGRLIDSLRYLMRRMQESTAQNSAMMKLEYHASDVAWVFGKPGGGVGGQVSGARGQVPGRMRDFWARITSFLRRQESPRLEGDPSLSWDDETVTKNTTQFRHSPSAAWHEPQVSVPYFQNFKKLSATFPQAATTLKLSTTDDVSRAVETAHADPDAWALRSLAERVAVFRRVEQLLIERKTYLMQVCQLVLGKTAREADGDLCEAIDFVSLYWRDALDVGERMVMLDFPGEDTYKQLHPLGVVAALSPYNFVAIPVGMMAAPLLMGNRVVIKPSERNVLAVKVLVELFYDAGVPRSALQLITSSRSTGRELGEALVSHPLVRLVNFTGSAITGNAIYEAIAKVQPTPKGHKLLIAEMGGKNPIIIDHDADLDLALPAILHSKFAYSGQKCSAVARVLVHESLKETFLVKLRQATLSLHIGDPLLDADVFVAPLIDREHAELIRNWKRKSEQLGKVLVGDDDWQKRGLSETGALVLPLIVTDVSENSDVYQAEIFGPVLIVNSFKTLDQAIASANHSAYDLTAGYYGHHPKSIAWVKQALQAGMLYINRKQGIVGARVGSDAFHAGCSASGVGTWGAPGEVGHVLRFVWRKNLNITSTLGAMVDPKVLKGFL